MDNGFQRYIRRVFVANGVLEGVVEVVWRLGLGNEDLLRLMRLERLERQKGLESLHDNVARRRTMMATGTRPQRC